MPRRLRSAPLILTLLTLLNLLNYLDRYVLSAVLAPMQAELDLSNFVAGLLPTVFLIGYFATSPVFGAWGDRTSRPWARPVLMASGVAVWSAATIATGLATAPVPLVLARAFIGVGEASFATLAPAIVDRIAPRGRTAAWQAVYCAATPIGSALGYLVGGAVAHGHGWRSAFLVAGLPGMVLAVPCALLADPTAAPSPETPARRADEPARRSFYAAASALARLPLYAGCVAGYCVYTFAIGGFAYWAPKYLHVRYGLEPGRASFQFGLLTVAGGALGTLLGGWAADRTARRRVRDPARDDPGGTGPMRPSADDDAIARANVVVCALAAGLGAPFAAAAILAPSAAGFFAMALPCQVAVFLLSGPVNVAILRAAPPALRASAMALAIFAIHAFGDLWSPPLIGLVADHAPMQVAMVAVPAMLAAAAIVWWRTAAAFGWLTGGARVR